jgi:hypothetical protein
MVVRTFKNVALDEISNTTRPAWYPSFGTVLSKSVKDAALTAPTGDNGLETNDLLDAVVEEATKSEAVPADDITKTSDAAMDAADATYILASLLRLLGDETDDPKEAALLRTAISAVQEYISMETAEIGTPEDVADTAENMGVMMSENETTDEAAVEKAGRKLSGATSAKLLGMFNTMQAELLDLGVLEAPAATEEIESEKSASDAEEDIVEKTDETEATALVVEKSETDTLAADLQKANERIAALEARPATALPGLVTDETKKAASDELADLLAKASPSDRVRLAFAAYTGGK